MPNKKKETLEQYRISVKKRLGQMMPYLQRAAIGDFSKTIKLPGQEDEFTELTVSINLMIEDLRDLKKELEDKNKVLLSIKEKLELENKERILKLKESEERYKELFENMSSAIAICRSDKNCTKFYFKDFNKKAEELENIKRENVLDKEVREIFPGAEAMGFVKILSQVCQTGVPFSSIEAEYTDPKTGTVSYRDNFIYCLSNGDVVAFYRDVSERAISKRELDKKIEELENLNKLMVGRELKMMELKKEIEKLKNKS